MGYDINDAAAAILTGKSKGTSVRLRVTSASNALPAALSAGYWKITPTVDVYYIQGGSTLAAAVANCDFLPNGATDWMPVEGSSDQNVAAITVTGSGYLYLTPKVR